MQCKSENAINVTVTVWQIAKRSRQTSRRHDRGGYTISAKCERICLLSRAPPTARNLELSEGSEMEFCNVNNVAYANKRINENNYCKIYLRRRTLPNYHR
uniref:Uncharacterized protein n=1 Tax=Wuchereria bancrofti TaxID=6293 RepID=A0AAF5PUH4_WUCBA